MSVQPGDALPEATLMTLGPDGPTAASTTELFGSGKSVLFAMPGAYTGTCTGVHVPSIVSAMAGLKDKGVATVAIVSVNDPFVMDAWGKSSGASEAGVTMLADADGSFTKAMGQLFDAAPVGLYGRSKRYGAVVEDGKVTVLDIEDNPGECDISGGTAILAKV